MRRQPQRLLLLALVTIATWLASCHSHQGMPVTTLSFVRDCTQVLTYRGPVDGGDVRVLGSWHAPGSNGDPLGKTGDRYEIAYALPPGIYTYQFFVGGVPQLDPSNPLTRYDQGVEASELRVSDCSVPELRVESTVSTADGKLEIRLQFWRSTTEQALDPSTVLADLGAVPVEVTVDADRHRLSLRAAGLPRGKHLVVVSAADIAGTRSEALRIPFWVEGAPFTWEDAVIYQILTDRFRGSQPATESLPLTVRHGGDLHGLLTVLESGYFESLGVNVLWISPLVDNPEALLPDRNGTHTQAYHGYWPQAPRTIEPAFGSEETLRALVEAAHQRGIRVIVDMVLNHVYREHPYYGDPLRKGWFYGDGSCVCGSTSCPWSSFTLDCWFTEFLPDANWRNPALMTQMVDDAMWWLSTFDLDGARLDAVPMMPRLAVRQLASRVHRELELGGVRHYLLGEIFTGPGQYQPIRYYLGPESLDGAFQFPLMWAIRDSLATQTRPLTELHQVMLASLAAYKDSGTVMAPFLGNHDISRFLSVAAGQFVGDPLSTPPATPTAAAPYQALQLALGFVLTIPGAPVIYYGDEFGLPGASDPDNRRMMRFDQELTGHQVQTLALVRKLGRLRRCSDALRRGDYAVLAAKTDQLAYLRKTGENLVVVVLNRSPSAVSLSLTLPLDVASPPPSLTDAVGGTRVQLDGRKLGAVSVEPRTVMVLFPSNSQCL